MNNLKLEIHDNIINVLNKVEGFAVGDILIEIPEGSVLFDNILSLKLIQKEVEVFDKQITFKTSDPLGKKLLDLLNVKPDTADGFVTKELSLNDISLKESDIKSKRKLKFKRPSLKAININMPEIKRFNPKLAMFLVLLVGGLGVGGYFLLWRAPQAAIKVVVNSQPLIKSVTIRISSTQDTNPSDKILKGSIASAVATETHVVSTTGEKTVGKKAEGEVTLVNRTINEINLPDGTIITYKGGSDLAFILDADVLVPPEFLVDPLDPLSDSTPGEANVNVTAVGIGSDYNIDSGETFDLDDYKKSELVAVSRNDFEGGSSKLVKVVTEDDLLLVSTELSVKLIETSEKTLKAQFGGSSKLVAGSVATVVTEDIYSGEVGDELAELELTQTISANGLTYLPEDLNKLLDDLVANFVPNGFKLSDEERIVNVEVLGNSDSTVLFSTEADLQVTLKTFVVPDIDEKRIIGDLAGKNFDDAQRILGSIRNIKTYELTVSPNIPLLRRVPSNPENIMLEVTLEE